MPPQSLLSILQSLSPTRIKLKKCIYRINSSIGQSPQIQRWTTAQKRIMEDSIKKLIQQERKQIEKYDQLDQQECIMQLERRLLRYSQDKGNADKIFDRTNHKKKQKNSQHIHEPLPQKYVYLTRKYNTKIAYQVHSISNAQNLQKQRNQKIRLIGSRNVSPLISRNVSPLISKNLMRSKVQPRMSVGRVASSRRSPKSLHISSSKQWMSQNITPRNSKISTESMHHTSPIRLVRRTYQSRQLTRRKQMNYFV